MRIAILERNANNNTSLERSIKGRMESDNGFEPSWKIDFFIDPDKFFSSGFTSYDIVMVDDSVKLSFDFIHKVHDTTDAELCILTDYLSTNYPTDLLKDDSIRSVLDKNDIDEIASHLAYIFSRKRLMDSLEENTALYETMA